jgi:hypothetical protein
VSQDIVRHLSQPSDFVGSGSLRRDAGMFRHRFSDRRVEASVRMWNSSTAMRILLEGQFGNRLADVAIVVATCGTLKPIASRSRP